MISPKKKVYGIAMAIACMFAAPVAATTQLDETINEYLAQAATEEPITTVAELLTSPGPVMVEPKRPWVGKGLTENEVIVLNYFQDLGITDKAALATLMGNVKQESKFISNICEGGQRMAYENCRRGGFGLIQWTTVDRYDGLGAYARATGGNPADLETQLGYLITERQWKSVEHIFKTPGKSIAQYMNAAYKWLGWGVHGARTNYSHAYYNKLVPAVPEPQINTAAEEPADAV